MSESVGKIRITADGQQAIREMDRVGKKVKTIGSEVGQWANSMSKTLVFAGAILGTVRSIAQAQEAARKAAADMAKEHGKSALSLGVSMARMGIGGNQAKSLQLLSERNPEVAEFISGLSGKRLRKGADVVGAAQAYASGMFDKDEIERGLKRGVKFGMLYKERESKLTPEAREELKAREKEKDIAYQSRDSASNKNRLAAAELERRRLQSPVAQALADQAENVGQFVGVNQSDIIAKQQSGEDRPSAPATTSTKAMPFERTMQETAVRGIFNTLKSVDRFAKTWSFDRRPQIGSHQ
jgi:hypothetical protein